MLTNVLRVLLNGKGLCLVKVITGHVKIQTHVQEWTRVNNPTCSVITFTRHKSHPWLTIYLKKVFMREKKTINILTAFFISHKSDVKTFLQWIINQYPKGTL